MSIPTSWRLSRDNFQTTSVQTPDRQRRFSLASRFVWLSICVSSVIASADQADVIDVSESQITRRLTAPMTTVVDGQTIDATLRSLQQMSQIAVWLDRDLDTGRVIENLRLGPSLYAALNQLAQQMGAKVVPVDAVVLVGSDDWLDRHVWELHGNRLGGDQPSIPIRVAWPDATTPSELLRFVRAANRLSSAADGGIVELPTDEISTAANINDELVHDHLRGGQWISVGQKQAERLLQISYATDSRSRRAEENQRWTDHYACSLSRSRLSKAVLAADSNAKFAVRQKVATLTGEPAAHRALRIELMDAFVAARQKQQKSDPRDGDTTFDLVVDNEPAGKVLASLAASAGRKLKVDESAGSALKQLISFQAKAKTLQELADVVGNLVRLDVRWANSEVVVSAVVKSP